MRHLFVLCVIASLAFLAAAEEKKFLSSIPEVVIPSAEPSVCIKKSTDPEGFDYKSLTISEQTQRFVDGPCSPLILVPGVQGSKLQVSIDCETLQKESPDAFSSCGWNTCEDAPEWEFWKRKPDSEYVIWVPDLFTPMDILLNVVYPKCWGSLFTLQYDANEPDFSQRLKNPPGITLQWYKQGTPQQQCGLDAIATLMPSPAVSYFASDFNYFQNMIISLQGLGYITGVSLFATPYDWRRSPESDDTHISITQTAELIKTLTGKKTVLLSHSLGNMQALYTLNGMSQADKDEYIAHYVAIMPPYVGATKAADMFLGDNYFDPFHAGISSREVQATSATSTSLYDIIPKPTYSQQANEKYMQDLMTRLNAEKLHDPSTPEGLAWWKENAASMPYQWFPTPNEQCSNGNINERNTTQCVMGIQDWAKDNLIQVQDLIFSATEEDLNKFITSGIAPWMPEQRDSIYNGVMSNKIGEINNPNVEVTTIYGASLRTMHSVNFDYNPAKDVSEGKTAKPTDITYELGDGTVPVSSALVGSLKWGWEFEHGTNPDAKPIHLLEWCSSYDNGTLEFNKDDSSFSGLWCKCLASSQSGSKCDHMRSVSDPNMINWVGNFLSNLENPVANGATPTGTTMTNEALTALATSCPSINNIPNDPDTEELFMDKVHREYLRN